MTIRPANSKDLSDLLKITRACALDMQKNGIFQWNEHYPNREQFQKDIARKELYVLTENEGLVGCIVISTLYDEFYKGVKWLTPDGHHFFIHRLAVHPSRQGKGYAQKLMDHAEAMARKQKMASIRLDTFSKNKRNQRFYEARGYQRTGEVFFPKQMHSF